MSNSGEFILFEIAALGTTNGLQPSYNIDVNEHLMTRCRVNNF
jgi:hypothetical protein